MDETVAGADAGAAVAAAGTGVMLLWLAVSVFFIVCYWKIFTKAGQPGWGCIIPIYNIYLLLKIAGKPGWWLILFLIPVVNLIIGIITIAALSSAFGKGAGFTVGLILLPIIFAPILAFGSAQYTAPAAA